MGSACGCAGTRWWVQGGGWSLRWPVNGRAVAGAARSCGLVPLSGGIQVGVLRMGREADIKIRTTRKGAQCLERAGGRWLLRVSKGAAPPWRGGAFAFTPTR